MSQTGSLWEKRRVKWLNARTPSRWMFALNTDGDIEAHDGVRVRAIIIHKISNPRSRRWCVFRRYHDGKLGGNDCFPSLVRAKSFCSDNPAVWGV